jgi:hypothetical protein
LNLQTVNGCDSLVTLVLTVNPTYNVSDDRTVCEGELPYVWNGITFTEAGTQTVTLQSTAGCDSVVTMTLSVNQSVTVLVEATACDSYEWNGQSYTASGDYTQTFTAANGCDSVVTLHLTINHAVSSEFTVETSDSCYSWNGHLYCASGDYVQTLTAANGCDSVVTLHLTTSVGVENHEVSVVFLAPSPTKNICRIMGLETDPVSVDVFDLRGKLLLRDDDTELDVSMLPTGMYTVRVNTGHRVVNLKLIKQ